MNNNKLNPQREINRAYRIGMALPAQANNNWSEDDKKKVRSLYFDGVGITEIAITMQRSELGIIQQLLRMEILTLPENRRKSRSRKAKCLCSKCLLQANCPGPEHCCNANGETEG